MSKDNSATISKVIYTPNPTLTCARNYTGFNRKITYNKSNDETKNVCLKNCSNGSPMRMYSLEGNSIPMCVTKGDTQYSFNERNEIASRTITCSDGGEFVKDPIELNKMSPNFIEIVDRDICLSKPIEYVPDNKMSDNRMPDNRMLDNRMSDNRMPDNKMIDNIMPDNRMPDIKM